MTPEEYIMLCTATIIIGARLMIYLTGDDDGPDAPA